MRIFLFLIFILGLSGCATIEVAKEVSKVSKSIKTSVENVTQNQTNEEEIKEKNNNEKDKKISLKEKVDLIKKEKKLVEVEKKKEKNLSIKQKESLEVNLIGKSINEIYMRLGDSSLFRLDGNTQTIRYDNDVCRLFLFFNASVGIPLVEHFEFRDVQGNLLKSKEEINKCYINFKLV